MGERRATGVELPSPPAWLEMRETVSGLRGDECLTAWNWGRRRKGTTGTGAAKCVCASHQCTSVVLLSSSNSNAKAAASDASFQGDPFKLVGRKCCGSEYRAASAMREQQTDGPREAVARRRALARTVSSHRQTAKRRDNRMDRDEGFGRDRAATRRFRGLSWRPDHRLMLTGCAAYASDGAS